MCTGESIEDVRQHYDRAPEKEWERLERHPFEFALTMHYLRQLLKPSSKVLDVGGGPGRYAIELAAMGHKVTLLDLSPGNVQLAQEKAFEQAVEIEGFHVGNATDLCLFPETRFDAVLCLGPMYHLIEEQQRTRAIEECLRVLKPGGLLAVSFISSLAPILDVLNNDPTAIQDLYPVLSACKESRVTLGSWEDHFTDAYCVNPFHVPALMSRFGIEKCAFIGAEAMVSSNESRIIRCGQAAVEQWIALAIEYAETNAALTSSIHLAYFGRKPMDRFFGRMAINRQI